MEHDEESYENNTHTFVVKIWLEELIGRNRLPYWRGHITHVPSGEQRYFEGLKGITGMIRRYLNRSLEDTHWLRRILYWIWSLIH